MDRLKNIISLEQKLRNNEELSGYSLYKELEKIALENNFKNLEDYFCLKRDYLFSLWKPEVYHIHISEYAKTVEAALEEGKDGIYISYGEGIHAYHGNKEIDYELCENLRVRVVELNYSGGTIIGSGNDFSIIIIFPVMMSMCHNFIIENFEKILSKYLDNITINNNDILMNGDKIAGSMTRDCKNGFIWATQISFQDYTEYIKKICNKPQFKKPSYVNSSILTRDLLEKEVVAWLRKEDID